MSDDKPQNTGPLHGLRILDLTRILAGPTATQVLGDLGADVIKVERPGAGDDTRKWGPPYATDAQGADTTESAYYLAANRNKRSVAIDIAHPDGQALVRRLLGKCDILVENFKVGGLAKYGLSYDQLKDEFPGLIYCSITGFGQTGPYAPQAGYDYLAQAMGGVMSITGEPDGAPMKIGVGVADVMCGMYACISILAAVRHRDLGGKGQSIDLALLDSQVSWLVNEGLNYLTSGEVPHRRGNAHSNIVPYQLFETADGHFILAVGNDAQFQRFCDFAGVSDLADDDRFNTNAQRIINREALIALLVPVLKTKASRHWLDGLAELGVPVGPVNTIAQVFEDPQVVHRGMKINMPHDLAGSVDLIASPIGMSETPVSYRRPPPTLGQHTDEVLSELLDMDADELEKMRRKGLL
ncbi:MAG: CoA transferase [Rhodospirillaceae bacterium]|jgi:crotonobetainyl-CoA:carnitine CoA-transferase CaiB-like acyl-CoA transferase|nr:CoA transferase [Rhodospirillaceae bacterium]MBT4219016.1 CoA transferase [Rhodospirillaceae bacterium]MBT5308224.1 CoA transferase [Rhodospirillaceae bacterium]MBT6407784.1 CoA transferase [Rhodospirillaceae bacterium]MBT7355414.1 CoA transferase [Rhodospirillaceae bacterium]